MAVNAKAVANLGEVATKRRALLIHFSTDYVFSGSKALAYDESDDTGPINVYGRSKLAGEQALVEMQAPAIILRTSWVFSAHGAPQAAHREAADRKLVKIDATCPLVLKVHGQIRRHHAAGRTVILIGHRNHPEVLGSMGQAPEGAVILVESPELAAHVLDYMEEGNLPENSYRVMLETDEETGVERLVWITVVDGEEARYYSEPEVGLWRRFSTWFMGLLPIEQHL